MCIRDRNGALDYDGRFQMNGGTLIALGSSGMAMAPSSDSKQNSVMFNVDAPLAAGKAIYLEDADGKFVIGAVPTRTIQSIAVSYTHLDVYKRQGVYFGEKKTEEINGELVASDHMNYAAVSYTHLDVYKRQAKMLLPVSVHHRPLIN